MIISLANYFLNTNSVLIIKCKLEIQYCNIVSSSLSGSHQAINTQNAFTLQVNQRRTVAKTIRVITFTVSTVLYNK